MFTVTDVMGRVVSSEKAASTIGTHTVNIGSFAAGVYYYSLNVDGKVMTKKMIAQ
jgi:FAD synthase